MRFITIDLEKNFMQTDNEYKQIIYLNNFELTELLSLFKAISERHLLEMKTKNGLVGKTSKEL